MNTPLLVRLSGATLALTLGACSAMASRPLTPGTFDVGMLKTQSPRVLPGAAADQSAASPYAVLSRFPGASEGVQPLSSLVSIGSTLYGTTYFGGGACRYGATGGVLGGCGIVFSFEPASKKVGALYRFTNGVTTGRNPRANLTLFNRQLYGTTYFGGKSVASCRARTSGCGVVFRVDPTSGAQDVVYAFRGGPGDGSNPAAGLLAVNDKLYGVTNSGGNVCAHSNASCGTIFSITSTGKEVVEYRFKGSDGANPTAALILVGDKLYGTTSAGGSGPSCPSDTPGCGTVFSFEPSTGALRTLYAFNGVTDGAFPRAPLVFDNGKLYGTTVLGGPTGSGVVFSVDRGSGNERIMYTFQGGNDGKQPLGGLVSFKGNLYGTTSQGGGKYNRGTVFAVNIKSRQERILHRFQGGYDGSSPVAALLLVNETLYGTTGARSGSNYGTIFSITP
jgi:uncharacterized repeat protein (TIGR03803 family)